MENDDHVAGQHGAVRRVPPSARDCTLTKVAVRPHAIKHAAVEARDDFHLALEQKEKAIRPVAPRVDDFTRRRRHGFEQREDLGLEFRVKRLEQGDALDGLLEGVSHHLVAERRREIAQDIAFVKHGLVRIEVRVVAAHADDKVSGQIAKAHILLNLVQLLLGLSTLPIQGSHQRVDGREHRREDERARQER